MTHLHQRREEITVNEVRDQCCLVAATNDGNGRMHCFLSNFGFFESVQNDRSQKLRNLRVRPSLMTESKVATRSEKTKSTLSRPAKTSMISELGFAYRLPSTPSKKTVRVCQVNESARKRRVEEQHSLTSSAYSSKGGVPLLTRSMARLKSCRVLYWSCARCSQLMHVCAM